MAHDPSIGGLQKSAVELLPQMKLEEKGGSIPSRIDHTHMTAKEEKMQRLRLLRTWVGTYLRDGIPVDKEYICAHMMVTYGVARRSCMEELNSVILWLKENPKEWQRNQAAETTIVEDVLKSTASETSS